MENKYSYTLVHKFIRSGIVETLYILTETGMKKITSGMKRLWLGFRGYEIGSGVVMGRNVIFFQSNKKSIRVGSGTTIGNGVRLKAGFSGRIEIGQSVLIEDNTSIFAHKSLLIGDHTMISAGCFITDFNHKYPHSRHKHLLLTESGYTDKTTTIGNNVWIGANACILGGVVIGDDAVIGAGAVVTKSISANHVAVGNPARVIKEIR